MKLSINALFNRVEKPSRFFSGLLCACLLLATQSWAVPKSRITSETSSDELSTHRYFSISLSPLPIGVGAAIAAPVVPIEAAVNLGWGFSIGPTLTLSGKFKYQEADYGLIGYGGQISWAIAHDAMDDGFYVQGFYTRYSLNASKAVTPQFDDFGGLGGAGGNTMAIPLEGSVPINSFGGTIGYQWVWRSGFRLATGVRMAYFGSDSAGITLLGQNVADLKGVPGLNQVVEIPVIKDQSQWIPMPELSLGWAF